MKKIILIAAILLVALTNGQAQVINKNAAKRIGEVIKERSQQHVGSNTWLQNTGALMPFEDK